MIKTNRNLLKESEQLEKEFLKITKTVSTIEQYYELDSIRARMSDVLHTCIIYEQRCMLSMPPLMVSSLKAYITTINKALIKAYENGILNKE